MELTVTHAIHVTPAEAGFLKSMLKNPQFWGISISNGMRGTAPVRRSLKERGLVTVARVPLVGGGGEKAEVAQLTEFGLAVAKAATAKIDAIEV